jgi:GDP-L-fucose synthase
MQSHINVGFGSDITIAELAKTVGAVIGYQGHIGFDSTKPDGMPRKLMDSSPMASLGVRPRVTLRDGLARTYRWFLDHYDELKK